jgi:hypothetical protein
MELSKKVFNRRERSPDSYRERKERLALTIVFQYFANSAFNFFNFLDSPQRLLFMKSLCWLM